MPKMRESSLGGNWHRRGKRKEKGRLSQDSATLTRTRKKKSWEKACGAQGGGKGGKRIEFRKERSVWDARMRVNVCGSMVT